MGVEMDHYVMFAVKFPSLDYFVEQVCGSEETYEQLTDAVNEEENGIEEISDGMSGDYVFIGEVLAKGDEFEGIPVTKCSDIEFTQDDKKALVKKVAQALCVPLESGKYEYEVGIWAFTHHH